jgi:hypothetical protein
MDKSARLKNIKAFILLGVIIVFAVFIWRALTYINPCECLRGYEGYGLRNNLTISERDKCVSLYGNNIPDSYRGTRKFSDQMIRNLRVECR